MTTYNIKFRTEAEHGSCDIDADSPEQALQFARQIWQDDPDAVDWCSFDSLQRLTDITILDDNETVLLSWTDPGASKELAASEMLDALELCEASLSELARLDDSTCSVSALHAARAVIAKAKGSAA